MKKSNSSVKKSNFGVKKILFFTLASMKKSRFGKEKIYFSLFGASFLFLLFHKKSLSQFLMFHTSPLFVPLPDRVNMVICRDCSCMRWLQERNLFLLISLPPLDREY
jgi:hypothetical protein